MKSNFYEKIIPIENEEKRKLLNKMSMLLDESIEDLINLRQRENSELNNIKLKLMDKYNEFISLQSNSSINERNNNNRNNLINNNNRLLEHFGLNRAARLERIRNMEEETEELNRLIENDMIEVIG